MTPLIIGKKTISLTHAPFIIAEAGINHNGSIETAFKMIDAAIEAGVDAVKFQTFTAKEFCSDSTQLFTYQSQGKEITEPMLDMFERMELSEQEWRQLKAYCDTKNILFLSTPQNPSDLALLLDIGIDAIKIGSDDFTNLPLISHYAKTGLPIILSCGMADLGEVYQALSTLGALKDDAYPCVLCLCTSQYPTPPQDINLKKLKTLAAAFPNLHLGFSDHSQGPLASSLAVTFGARVFEKHFTLDNDLAGPDHWFSENPQSLKQWVEHIHSAFTMLGSEKVEPTEKEKSMRVLARRSIVALKDISAGETLNENSIGLRRPGDGLPPAYYAEILGKKASRDIPAFNCLNFGDFTNDE
ncbi:N-acetylneuraminate synthase family protein [Colwelliaceae bacterium 6441]